MGNTLPIVSKQSLDHSSQLQHLPRAQVLDLTDSENDTGGGRDAVPIEQGSNAAAAGSASKPRQHQHAESSGEPTDKQSDSCIDLT